MEKIAVLIVAAGRGNRAPGDAPKQYRQIAGETVLTKTLKCFAKFPHIMVVIHPDDQDLYEDAVSGLSLNIQTVHGGATRTNSVKAGLNALSAHAPKYVLIHDAARPFLQDRIIQNVIDGLSTHQACVPALPIVDALKTLDGETVDRDSVMRVQTPQGFRFDDIYKAYQDLPKSVNCADDIEIAKRNGHSIKMCEGDESNIKLTYERDFMQKTDTISVTGSGYDVHQICQGTSLWLCGIEIEAGFSLKGHSDADVGLHALTDAILGAIAAGDIGDHFPPTDPKWKGASSDIFLRHAKELVDAQGGNLDHVDVTLICEKPKIKPHREAMRAKIAEILDMPIRRISVKATTTEGLGFTGRAEGIAASAIVSLRIPDAE
ncbi:MAG: bifunctional 2-C-methyl-D-erythritol 4-phosphate cytidylyltransferase/2-C-methyl-D-erythritol 2,4-cyclodiphosphate synthase [Robiginitomaculum sp.]|nr:MAG: bifunctional 2-C-methyl-D-erythritol 4-phosphate cytidylyltransferase/2-C-methyl-D-erythritol 2,4-cyclodiphosphate synthase [Robiginitomaculum sp.]